MKDKSKGPNRHMVVKNTKGKLTVNRKLRGYLSDYLDELAKNYGAYAEVVAQAEASADAGTK